MLHELLLALSGHPGEVFVKTATGLQVAAHVPYLHPSERDTLNEILKIGYAFIKIEAFVDSQSPLTYSTTGNDASALIHQNEPDHSLYLAALQTAIRDVVLTPYCQYIVELEQRILREDEFLRTATPLSFVRSQLEPFSTPLQTLVGLIHRLTQRGTQNAESALRGARVLDMLRENCHSGVPQVVRMMKQLYDRCVCVWWNQVFPWVIHGRIVDPTEEFFVVADTKGLGSTPSFGHPPRHMTTSGDDSDIPLTGQWDTCFRFLPERWPQHCPVEVGQIILFLGKVNALLCTSRVTGESGWKNSDSVPQFDYAQRLEELVSRNLFLDDHLTLLPELIALRHAVTRWVWVELNIGVHLERCLEAFRDYYLLGHGDLWNNVLDELGRWDSPFAAGQNGLQGITRPKSTWTSFTSLRRDRELLTILRQASAGTSAEHDDLFSQFTLCTASPSTTPTDRPVPHFNHRQLALQLDFTIPWPLDILISTQKDLARYQKIFAHLLTLRRVQSRIHQVCARINRTGRQLQSRQLLPPKTLIKASSAQLHTPMLTLVYQLRWQMLQWIDGLVAHSQTDIVGFAYSVIRRYLDSTMTVHRIPDEGTASIGAVSHSSNTNHSMDVSVEEDEERPNPTRNGRSDELPSATMLDIDTFRALHAAFLRYVEQGLFFHALPLWNAVRETLQTCEAICGVCERWLSAQTIHGEAFDPPSGLSVNEQQIFHALQELQSQLGKQLGFLFRSLNFISQEPSTTGQTVRHDPDFAAMESADTSEAALSVGASDGMVGHELTTFQLAKHLDQLLLRLDFNRWFSNTRLDT
ncbi:hypothetical protein IWQ62_003100 [Dispira parvispora]|uniref:Spindle pole body component n=1 Tax=Dispira parvispora TaxID=1520584 RepID=A0A9W8AUD8_9FUNG|nr:hypothetical protein IWQ62_003100 [Dispira parvispora]